VTIQDIEDQIVADFEPLEGDQEMYYEHLIDQGKTLPALDTQYQTDEYMVRGCQSKVWVRAYMDGELLMLQADSNTAITKGIVALLLQVLSGQKPSDILDTKLDFISRTQLREHLSSQRANGLGAMIARIRHYANDNL
jgi:cysteine desulfuration protein SufE